jgi:glycosyltransferase involved in cell wall biosynthesis
MKVALVYSFTQSSWFSCTIINQNIRKAYDLLLGEENIIHVHYGHDRKVSSDDIKELITKGVDKVIFIDHKPTPINFLQNLSRLAEAKNFDPEFVIHVFGDFPLYLREWRSVNELLEGKRVKYICASEKQKLFVEKFLKQPDIISVCPFPVDTNKFKYDATNIEKTREHLGIGIQDPVFLYTGRLSYQKRIKEMISLFKESIKQSIISADSKLVIVGEFDKLGFPYLDQQQLEGEYFRMIEVELSTDPELSKNIVLTGNVKNNRLNDYYSMADYYFSLSTYHDEDYGMSVAEAGCCGLPLVLTNWAGYYSFQMPEHKEYCEFVPVKLTRSLPEFKNDDVLGAIKKMCSSRFSHEDISKDYASEFSVSACSRKLGLILDKKSVPYECGTDFMVKLTNYQFIKNNQMFMSETTKEFNSIYYKAYDVYAK